MPPKAPGFVAQVTAPLVSAVASSAMGGGAAKPQNAAKPSGAKAGPSTSQPTSGEVSLPARYPLIAALQAIGGPENVLSASNLMLVTTTFPKSKPGVPGMENRYVTGLQGNVSKSVNVTFKGQKIQLDTGDQFRIRWDFDPGNPPDPTKNIEQVDGKGVHLNAEFFGKRGTTKIAFTPSMDAIVSKPGNRNSDRYDMTVGDMSTWLDYQTKVNTTTHVFTMKERTGETNADRSNDSKPDNDPTDNDRRAKALKEMALKLAGRWRDMYATAPKE